MKLNPQQAPLYVSTKFQCFFPLPSCSHKMLPRPLLAILLIYALLPEDLACVCSVALQMPGDNPQVSYRAPLSFKEPVLRKLSDML